MRNILLSVIVTLVVVSTSEATWMETFDTGVGRFKYYEENGDTVFSWNSLTQSLDATFIRQTPADKRYAIIPTIEDVHSVYYGFSTIIRITGELPGPTSDPASGLFGFMNSAGSELYGCAFIQPVISRPSEGRKEFYIRTGGQTTETHRISTETIPFEFGTTYFVDAFVNGPDDIFQVDFYEGENKNGIYLGTLTVEFAPQSAIGFDAVGFSGMWDSQQTVVEANFDNFAFVPEPATLLLLSLGAMMLRKNAEK